MGHIMRGDPSASGDAEIGNNRKSGNCFRILARSHEICNLQGSVVGIGLRGCWWNEEGVSGKRRSREKGPRRNSASVGCRLMEGVSLGRLGMAGRDPT